MFKMVLQDFRAEFFHNIKEERKNIWLYLILTCSYSFLFIRDFLRDGDKQNMVWYVNFLLLIVLVEGINNIYPNRLEKIMLLVPLTREEKYEYLKIRLVLKQMITLIVAGGINVVFICIGYTKVSTTILGMISLLLFGAVVGITTNKADNQINHFFEVVNIFVGFGNFLLILSGESFMEIPRNINYVIIAVLSIIQVAGSVIIIKNFKKYAKVDLV